LFLRNSEEVKELALGIPVLKFGSAVVITISLSKNSRKISIWQTVVKGNVVLSFSKDSSLCIISSLLEVSLLFKFWRLPAVFEEKVDFLVI